MKMPGSKYAGLFILKLVIAYKFLVDLMSTYLRGR